MDLVSGKDAAAVAAAAQKNMKESFFRSLPRACFGFLLAVLFDQCLMLGYAGILLTSGSNTSAYYFAACILLFAFALGYFSLSAVRSENLTLALALALTLTLDPSLTWCRCAPRTRSSCSRLSWWAAA